MCRCMYWINIWIENKGYFIRTVVRAFEEYENSAVYQKNWMELPERCTNSSEWKNNWSSDTRSCERRITDECEVFGG